jgi:alcohol dehydrogenase
LDGEFDVMSHCIEVFFGAPEVNFTLIQKIAETSLDLMIGSVEKALDDGEDIEAREALGLGTDLGGYAIMLGGTSGPHLTSFSLVDILSHGRACAIMNPYFTVFFAPAIQKQLKILIEIYVKHGLVTPEASRLAGRELGEAVATGMLNLARRLNFPITLAEIPGFSQDHLKKALEAAKNPQLEMKLKNMPVPLESRMVDDYLAPVLEAARSGDFKLIKN